MGGWEGFSLAAGGLAGGLPGPDEGRGAASRPACGLRPAARITCSTRFRCGAGGSAHGQPTTLLTLPARPCRGPCPAPPRSAGDLRRVETLSPSVEASLAWNRVGMGAGGGRIGHCACALRTPSPPLPPESTLVPCAKVTLSFCPFCEESQTAEAKGKQTFP